MLGEVFLKPGWLQVRHGAVLGAAEVLLACCQKHVDMPEGLLGKIRGLPATIIKDRLLLGKGGELMRIALCRSVNPLMSSSLVTVSVAAQVVEKALKIKNDSTPSLIVKLGSEPTLNPCPSEGGQENKSNIFLPFLILLVA